jgi:SAM-dependent methyltransferase
MVSPFRRPDARSSLVGDPHTRMSSALISISERWDKARESSIKKIALGALAALLVLVLAYPLWKPAAKRVKWFVILTNIGQDSLRRFGLRSGQIGQSSSLSSLSRDESGLPTELARIQGIYRQYLRYAEWQPAMLAGKRMLELGPGFTIGVPLMFAADGAEHAAGLDKFVPLQDGPFYVKLYSQIRGTLNQVGQANFDAAIQLSPRITLNPSRLTYVYGKDVTECVQDLGPATYDLIVSNAVLEEMYDPTPVFEAQGRLLRPGGLMIHKIDFGDYGMFSKHGFHPLEFLTVPDWAYRRMVESSGQPNRRLVNYYRDTVAGLGYQSTIYIARVLGAPEMREPKTQLQAGTDYSAETMRVLDEIRPELLPRYRSLPNSDLLVQGIILVARKPAAGKI